ncbi:MAG: hypothetical protein HYT82_00260, partial [Candidatus Harrisonbacteria bacterium]|nr:hypothetical protein [Candidatus Harrisonbacteria bacterium]
MTKKHIAMFGATVALLTQLLPFAAFAQTSPSTAANQLFSLRLVLTLPAVKEVSALKAGESLTGKVYEQATEELVPVIFEQDPKDSKVVCIYLPDGMAVDSKAPLRVAVQRDITQKILGAFTAAPSVSYDP